jgi:hypothetical protein
VLKYVVILGPLRDSLWRRALATEIGDRVNTDEMGTYCTFLVLGFPSSRAHHDIFAQDQK